ncbi:MAG: sigma-54-dependent Fis family transcriptional regulator [Deltaproteobacteria bacterium]|nr:sigma-54-dependent Fis family transcriptional regulator [Deltaproteobacteria bacterium]
MTPAVAHILIVDDEPIVRDSLAAFLRDKGYLCDLAATGPEALGLAARTSYHLVILDIRMPGMDGIAVLGELKTRQPDLPVLMITAYADVATAVAAMRAGAYDYMVKPFDPEEIALVVRNVVAHHHLIRENLALRRKLEERERFEELLGRSPPMRAVFEMIAAVADTGVTVLLTGESGTGKELAARAIHRRSLRASGPFVAVSCGGLPDTLIESELFGHERGAFTGAVARHRGRFELAAGGTLFFDEVGDVSPKTQVDLLRAIETKRFVRLGGTEEITADVRIVAATNRDLGAMVKQGGFREDLYYRLNVVGIRMPPLRERTEDIGLLASHFIDYCARQMSRPARGLSPDAMALMLAHDWPGNVRELANAIERAVAVGRGEIIEPCDLPLEARPCREAGTGKTLHEVEQRHVAEILEQNGWNISRAATTLGIDRVTLYKKMRRFGIQRPARPAGR